MTTFVYKGGRGVKKLQIYDYVVYEWPQMPFQDRISIDFRSLEKMAATFVSSYCFVINHEQSYFTVLKNVVNQNQNRTQF